MLFYSVQGPEVGLVVKHCVYISCDFSCCRCLTAEQVRNQMNEDTDEEILNEDTDEEESDTDSDGGK